MGLNHIPDFEKHMIVCSGGTNLTTATIVALLLKRSNLEDVQ